MSWILDLEVFVGYINGDVLWVFGNEDLEFIRINLFRV